MKLKTALFFLLGSSLTLTAEPTVESQDEVMVLLELIELGQKNLEQQQHLLKSTLEFKKLREAFLQDPTSSRVATALVRSAMTLYQEIQDNHLAHLFSDTYISELRFYSKLGKEQKISLK